MRKEIVALKILLKRITGVLSKTDQALHNHADGLHTHLGEWYVVNLADGSIDHAFVDLEQLATDLGCIKSCEKIVK